MSKGTKLTELPKLEEWKAPWEVKKDAEGNPVDVPEEEQVIDKDQLKRYLYGLLNDKINFRNQLDETTAEAEELQQKLASAQTPEELQSLKEENARLVQERDAAKEKANKGEDGLKWLIALEKGLTKTQAKRLMGTTREELEADADEIVAEWGHRGEGGGNGGNSGDDVRRAPRRRLTNAGDPDPEAGRESDGKEEDPDEVVKRYFANR